MGEKETPNGWQIVRLRDLGEVNRGKSKHRPRYAKHLYGGHYPFIQTGDIKASNGRITSYTQTYSKAGLAQSRLWPAETMCITIAANIAETGILAFPACFPDSVVGFIADKSKADVYFIEYVFRFLRQRLQREAAGSVQDNINLATLDRLKFPIPPLETQQAIAHILGTLDDKIELNCRMNRTLEQIAKAIFKSWFIDFDPVRAKAEGRQPEGMDAELAALFPSEFEDSALGEIPRGWRVRPLDEIATFLNGLACQKHPPEGKRSLPVIKIRELRQGVTENTDRASADFPEDYVVDNGDILFSWSGSLLAKPWCGGRGALNQHIFKVSSDEYPKWFYFYWVQKHLDDFQMIAKSKATTMGHIKRQHLSEAMTAVPSSTTLEVMNKVMTPFLKKQIDNELYTRSLEAIRDLLLPRLISGNLPIRDAESFLEETT